MCGLETRLEHRSRFIKTTCLDRPKPLTFTNVIHTWSGRLEGFDIVLYLYADDNGERSAL